MVNIKIIEIIVSHYMYAKSLKCYEHFGYVITIIMDKDYQK